METENENASNRTCSGDGRVQWMTMAGRFGLRTAVADASKRDYRLLGFYFIAMGSCSWPVMNMLAEATAANGLSFHLSRIVLLSLGYPPIIGLYVLVGLFVGILLVLAYDSFKRLQTFVLLIAILLGVLLVVLRQGGFPFIVKLSPSIAFLGLSAVLSGLILGGFRLSDITSDPPHQYPRAALLLFSLAFVVCLVGLFEAHLVYQSPLLATSDGYETQSFVLQGFDGGIAFVYHATATVVWLFALYEFTSYERDMNIFVIGPARSGKSALFGGLRSAIQTEVYSGVVMEDSEAGTVDDLSDAIQMGEFPPPTQPGEVRVLTLPFIPESLVPERIRLQSVDYPGESLQNALRPVLEQDGSLRHPGNGSQRINRDLADEIANGESEISNIERERIPEDEYGQADSWNEAVQRVRETENPVEVPPRVWDCLQFSDRVVLVVPIDDFIGPVLARGNTPSYIDVLELEDPVPRDEVFDRAKEAFEHENLNQEDVKQITYQGRSFVVTGAPYRAGPEDYLTWYRSLVREMNDEMDFLIVGTIADWAKEDFMAENERPNGTRPFPSTNPEWFCEYVYDELLTAELPMIEQIRNGIDEDQIHLVWYDIANEAPPRGRNERFRIKTDKESTILEGGKTLLDRIEQ